MAGSGNNKTTRHETDLIEQVGGMEMLALNPDSEAGWIDVIQKMDDVYADLVGYQVELEEKNAALEEAQQFISSVLSSVTDVLIVCDVEGRIQRVNRALERLVGQNEAHLLNLPLSELFADDSRSMVGEFAQKIRADAIVDCEVSLRAADGSAMPLATNCASRYDHNGRLVGMVLIGRPVGELRRAYEELSLAHGELKQTQQQLIQSEKMASLGRLVAGVAHELNNPISFVFGNVHALRRYEDRIMRYIEGLEAKVDKGSLKTLREELNIERILADMGPLIDGTLEGAERVSEIVQELRRFSSGQTEQVSCFELPEVIRTAVHWVVKSARSKPQVAMALPEALAMVARKGHVHQILVNLVQNAVDMMEADGGGDGESTPQLEIHCEVVGPQVQIAVRDHGPGIEAEALTRIFDPFYTTKPVGKGTGLGLYISYNLAIDQGGDLTAANHPEGGAVFTLTLPLEVGDGRP